MWNLDDITMYKKVCSFSLDEVATWGNNDTDKRKRIRSEAVAKAKPCFPSGRLDDTR